MLRNQFNMIHTMGTLSVIVKEVTWKGQCLRKNKLQFHLCTCLLQDIEQKEEAKLRMKYPGLKAGGGSFLAQKRLSRGVGFYFTFAEILFS